jgi:hypothetical protein
VSCGVAAGCAEGKADGCMLLMQVISTVRVIMVHIRVDEFVCRSPESTMILGKVTHTK